MGVCLLCPSRAQTIMKARLKGAQTGRSLLKKKSDALSMRFRQILRKIIEVRKITNSIHSFGFALAVSTPKMCSLWLIL